MITTKGISYLNVLFLTGTAVKSAAIPRIRKTLSILLPITLPTAIPALFWNAEFILIAASGALVPKATIVRPITISGTLSFVAILDAPSTNASAPLST